MATLDSNKLSSVLEKMFSHFVHREEVNNMPRFMPRVSEIERHLQVLNEKAEYLNLSEEENLKFLNNSLDEDVKNDIRIMPNFKEKSKTFKTFSIF